jgi:arginase
MKSLIRVIGAPTNLGCSMDGPQLEPRALRRHGLYDALSRHGMAFIDSGDITIPAPALRNHLREQPRHLPQVCVTAEILAREVHKSLGTGELPLVIGGDHSIALGTVTGLMAYARERKEPVSVIWFDAHADMNTPETSPSGNVHGMPLASLLGFGAPEAVGLGGFCPKILPENLVIVGARSIDPGELDLVKRLGIQVISAKDFKKLGPQKAAEKTLKLLGGHTKNVHFSFDIDGLDPQEAAGVSTPVPDGISSRNAAAYFQHIAHHANVLSMEVAEYNPLRDSHNSTASIAAATVAAALEGAIVNGVSPKQNAG